MLSGPCWCMSVALCGRRTPAKTYEFLSFCQYSGTISLNRLYYLHTEPVSSYSAASSTRVLGKLCCMPHFQMLHFLLFTHPCINLSLHNAKYNIAIERVLLSSVLIFMLSQKASNILIPSLIYEKLRNNDSALRGWKLSVCHFTFVLQTIFAMSLITEDENLGIFIVYFSLLLFHRKL